MRKTLFTKFTINQLIQCVYSVATYTMKTYKSRNQFIVYTTSNYSSYIIKYIHTHITRMMKF